MSSVRSRQPAVGAWLVVCVVLVLATVVIGGATRLARAGLSITTWDPVAGVLPPLDDAAWQRAHDQYRETPEGRLVNAAMTHDEFRGIYLLEYGHRLLGRVVGLVLIVPLAYFALRRRLGWRRAGPLLGIFVLGALQGVLGWYMVASGLVDAPHVSPYRLTSHLVVGMTLLAWLAWSAHTELLPARVQPLPGRTKSVATITLALAFATIMYGALMAGHHAGLVCSTFPLMNGEWLPGGARLDALLSDAWTVHVIHRGLGFALGVAVLATSATAWRTGARRLRAFGVAALLVVLLQIAIGGLLVLGHVPPLLASLHQGNGALLLVLMVCVLREASAATPGVERSSRFASGTQLPSHG